MKNQDVVKAMRQKVFGLTRDMIKRFGPRKAGTQACLDCADALHETMTAYADKVETQAFKVHAGAFLGWIRILVVAYLLGIIALWLSYPFVTAALMVISLLILILQFIFYLPVIDWAYPRKPAKNVIATVEPEGTATQQIIISGHHDSARVFNFFIHQPGLYNLRVTGSIVLVIAMFAFSLFAWFSVDAALMLLIGNIVLSVGGLLVVQMWFFASKKATPGAGDNLIASNIAVVLGEHFSLHRLKQTRLILASFDAEEEGLRGARAYAKAYRNTLQSMPTWLLNADCLYHEKELFFLTTDINGTVKLDKELANSLVKIASQEGYKTKTQPLAFLTGGTDAAELAKIGVRATTLIGMPWTNNDRSNVYHTPDDTADKVTKPVVEAALIIFKRFVETLDENKKNA